MIDTVRFLTRALPDEDQLLCYWRRNELSSPTGEPTVKYIYNTKAPYPLRATYRPKSHTGLHQLSIELSLPKLILGNNWEMLYDIPGAIPLLDAIFARSPALPPLPSVGEMTVSRLDICYNYEVGNHLAAYIEALSRLEYAHRTTARFNTQTVEFRCKSVKCKFYDKHAETKGEAPAGLLRHETTLHRAAPVKRALAQHHPVLLTHLTLDRLRTVLEHDLEAIGIRDRCFLNTDYVYEMLVTEYGSQRGPRLFGFWTRYQHLSKDDLARQTGIKRNTINRILADIRNAGVPLGAIANDEPLPPLRIIIPDPIPPVTSQICTQTPGVTQGSLPSAEEASPPCE